MTEHWNINHWNVNGFREILSRQVLREKIEAHGDNIMRRGQLCYLKSKPIAAGMYNVWFEPKEPTS